ncbi:MAG: SDR family oxidoreductase [Candidatus Sumerlaeaceae bacterium]|nr:SDR family oxidoreductase [Candidatus Sumerlaeaceae bacterium]
MRVVVTGASGYLGYHLTQYLGAQGIEVVGLWRREAPKFEHAIAEQVDLADSTQVHREIAKWNPTHIVHCAAMTSTAQCETDPQAAFRDNFATTQNLVTALNEALRARPFFLFVSTDLVFDGKKGLYKEEDQPNPLMVYGRTKLAAEQAVELTYQGEWAIVRSALIYGRTTSTGRATFLTWLVDGIKAGECRLFVDEYRSPIAITELCWFIHKVLKERAVGIWHAAGPDRISRYEIGLLVAQIFGLAQDAVKPVRLSETPVCAPRPADVSMDIAKARSLLEFSPAPMAKNLQKLANQWG